MKRRLALLFLLSFVIPCVFSEPVEDLIGHDNVIRLLSGAASETQVGKPMLKLLPDLPELRQFVTGSMTALEPTVTVETLYLYTKHGSSAASWNDAQRAALFNQMLAISTLTGIEYFSASRNKMRTFYEYSSVIDDPSTKKPLPDPVFEQPPTQYTLYARQKDLTFGDNIYRYDYTAAKDALFFIQENMTSLNYGIITAVGKNRLKSVMAVIDCGEHLLIYAVSMAKAASFPGMADRIGNSFKNRADAVYKWFASGANKVF
jgi:hypothetical protein